MRSLQDKFNLFKIDCKEITSSKKNYSWETGGFFKRNFLRFQHKFNPVHIYCRLIENGWSRDSALKFSCAYETMFYKPSTFLASGVENAYRFVRVSMPQIYF